jgi:asparagine synthase (glutamine-hydrolysing)
MCGIFGVISTTPFKNFLNIYESGMTNKSRGPERQCISQTDNMFLMFHRLCINGLSNQGDGPFIYSDRKTTRTFSVLCNGEIYNHKFLKDFYDIEELPNDTSYIFPVFERLNKSFYELNRELLRSEYSLAIIESINNKPVNIYLSVDTSSVRPLFYAVDQQNGIIAFSSLLKGLTNIENLNKKEIQRLPGGFMIQITLNDELKISKYMFSSYLDNINTIALTNNTNEDQIRLQLISKLYESVRKRCISDRPIGCLLSGGLDSSLVAALAAKILTTKLRTFSIGMEGGTDLKYAKMVADHIGSEHTEIIFTSEEGLSVLKDVIKVTETFDITTIRASVAQYLLAKWISENTDIKVVLNGDGADEIQCGYLYYHNAPSEEELHEDSMKLIDNIHLFDGLRVDRCISHFGLEARLPYLDYSLVHLYKITHPSLKKPKEGFEKYLIRNAFEKYYVKQPILPKEVLWRTKEAFSDAVSSTDKSWYQMIQEYIEQNEEVDMTVVRQHCPPHDKESTFYRDQFEKMFGKECEEIIPYYWKANWNTSQNPSARTLQIYKDLHH